MKRIKFLNKLRKEGKLQLVEPSEEMKESYLLKAENCLKSAKILLPNKLYENSVIDSYYSMYNSLLAFLFKVGIKSENHTGSIAIFEEITKEKELAEIIWKSKEEREDKQYYVETQKNQVITEKAATDMISKAEDFVVKMKLLINKTSNQNISNIKLDFNKLLPQKEPNFVAIVHRFRKSQKKTNKSK